VGRGIPAAAELSRYKAVCAAVDPRPPHGEPVQRLLIDILSQVRIGGEQRRRPQQRVTGLGDEAFKSPRLLPVHVVLSLSASPS